MNPTFVPLLLRYININMNININKNSKNNKNFNNNTNTANVNSSNANNSSINILNQQNLNVLNYTCNSMTAMQFIDLCHNCIDSSNKELSVGLKSLQNIERSSSGGSGSGTELHALKLEIDLINRIQDEMSGDGDGDDDISSNPNPNPIDGGSISINSGMSRKYGVVEERKLIKDVLKLKLGWSDVRYISSDFRRLILTCTTGCGVSAGADCGAGCEHEYEI